MPSIFGTFNILKRAMQAQQFVVNTTSHNIANANTEGYSRQIATLKASTPESAGDAGRGQLGTGVEVSAIGRARDIFLDTQIRNELSTSGNYTSRDEFLSEIETIFLEPSENGISTSIGKMWNSWQELANNPDSSTTRTTLVQSSLALTAQLNHTYNQLDTLQKDSKTLIQQKVAEFNDYVTQIKDLNSQIQGVTISKNNPNDLLDRQDLLIDKLAGLVDIRVSRNELGNATITSGDGTTVIVGTNNKTMSFIQDVTTETIAGVTSYSLTYYDKGDITTTPVTVSLPDKDTYDKYVNDKVILIDESTKPNPTAFEADLKNGSIAGYSSIYTELGEYKSELNTEARALAVAVNTVHSGKTTNVGYVAFFTAKDVNPSGDENKLTAQNITVNPDIQSGITQINAGVNPTVSATDPKGNGDRALAISKIRDARIDMSEFTDSNYDRWNNSVVGDSGPPIIIALYDSATMKIGDSSVGTTVNAYFQDTISKLGSSAGQAKNMVANQDALIGQLQTRKDSISGVSIDEETANLLQYQRAYQAAAKAIQIVTEMLDSVIGLIR